MSENVWAPSEINALLPHINPTEIFKIVKKQFAITATIAAFLPPFERKSSLINCSSIYFIIICLIYNYYDIIPIPKINILH